ncbi:MAG TPA: hypothetical protein VII53_08960 [Solirubrobacteraceae bacterium]
MRNQRTHILPRLVLAGLALMVILLLPAPSALASGGCPNEQVRDESSINPTTGQPYDLSLSECRAYEMVTPLDKQGFDALYHREGEPAIVAGNGDGIEWTGQGDYAGAENYQVHSSFPTNPYVATRTSTGWTTRSGYPSASTIVQPFQAFGGSGLYPAELTTEMVCGATEVISDEEGPSFRCGVRGEDGTWTFTPTYTDLTNSPFHMITFGGSRTGNVYVLQGEEGVPFTSADISSCQGSGSSCGGIYEVTGIGGPEPKLRLVDVDNAGNMIGPENANAVGALSKEPYGGAYQAISANGEKIFFTATPAEGVPTLYARIDGKETADISDPSPAECTTCNPTPYEGRFQGASANGETVFFTTKQQLVSSDTDEAIDLYEYAFSEPVGHALTQVSAGGLGDATPGAGANVEGVVGVSEDGSHVYFAAGGVLTTLPNGRGERAQRFADNLYGYDTETHETKFVAALSGADSQLWGQSTLSGNGTADSHLAQITPNGEYLVFDTAAPLITSGAEADTSGTQQVWRYDFQTGALIRVSVGHEGFAADGNVAGYEAVIAPADLLGSPASPAVNETSRTISEDGETVAFVSAAALQDTDHAAGTNTTCVHGQRDLGPGCEVYLWQECSGGVCADGNAGEVDLISDGVNPEGTIYAGMSADGSNIFFQTWAQLVHQDTDGLGDIYDARVDGGFPAPTPEPSCSGEACQGTQSSSPAFGTPGSQTFTGGGNQTAPPFKEVLEPGTKRKSKPLTNAQKLARALKQCRRDRVKARRVACEKASRKRFGPKPKAKRKK